MNCFEQPVTPFGLKFHQVAPLSITKEEGSLLHALVRLRKPAIALETGTGRAGSTYRIAAAINENEEGHLHSCETNYALVGAARDLLESLPVTVHDCTGLEMLAKFEKADFIFVDAGDPANRQREIDWIMRMEMLCPKGILVIHDAINPRDGGYQSLLEKPKAAGWPMMLFETPAGIAFFQRP